MAAPCSGPRSTPPPGAAKGPWTCGEGLIPAMRRSASWLVACPYIIGGRGLFLPPSSPSLALLAASRPVPPRRSVRLRSLAAGGVASPRPARPSRLLVHRRGVVFPRPTSGPVPPPESSISELRPRQGGFSRPATARRSACAFVRLPISISGGAASPRPACPRLRPVPPAEGCPSPSARGSLTQARLPAYLPLSKFRPRRIEREYGRPPGRNRSCPRNCARRAAPN